MIVGLSVFLLTAPNLSYADGNVVDQATALVKENPGKSLGVAGCAALFVFPPGAILCVATLVGGGAYDGDIQKMLKEITK